MDWNESSRHPFGNKHWNKGRVPRKFLFTYEDIAKITRLSVPTIRAYVHLKKFDPTDLGSVIRFVAPYLGYKEVI